MLSKLSVGLVLFCLLAIPVIPRAAHAQVAISTYPAFEAWASITATGDKIKTAFSATVLTYLINLMSFAADRLAYDAAVAISSGGPAESSLYDGTPVEVFFKEYGAAVAGESIGLLQDDLEASGGAIGAIFQGFDLCQPRADVTISLNLGIKGVFDRPTPKCDFKGVKDNWNGFVADISDEGTGANNKNQMILTQLADAFDPQTNEFAVGVELQSSILNKTLQDSFFKANQKLTDHGFNGVLNFVTGNVDTPAEAIADNFYTAKNKQTDAPFRALDLAASTKEGLLQVGIHMGSVFTNTLLSEMTKKLYEGLFETDPLPDPFGDIENIASSSAASAREQFSSLLAFTPLEISNYSILSDFGTCPSGENRGLYNCVANSSFISAIARADSGAPLTVAEAMEQGLIDGNWPLIPSDDLARDQDPFCFTYGFCHTNLVKLRKARVISIGWELAAESIYNSADKTVTLKEVVDGFDDCEPDGTASQNHKWCKLIDPNWVLKYPETQCKALVNGQLLVSPGADERQQECVDMPSCIAENDDGTCTGGYGYCVKEENVWRFRGESCPAQFASCLTFRGEDKTASFLQTTVDYADCNAQNAGCLWYDTEKADPENDGTYDWQPVTDVAAADAASDAHDSRIYFTSAVEECDEDNGGCSEVIERDDSVRLNVIRNPGFENDSNNDGVADGWSRNSTGLTLDSSGLSRSGRNALDLGFLEILTQPGISVSQGRFYTFSFYARQRAVGDTDAVVARLQFSAANPGNDINFTATSFVGGQDTDCTISNSNDLTNGDGLSDVIRLSGTPDSTGYQRFTCTFTSPVVPDLSSLILGSLTLAGDGYVDDVQLEQGESASTYHEGYSTLDLAQLTVKLPPAYLGCQGNESDPAECANYAAVCSENDVGCSAYTPTNGDPTVTGVASELDACPSVCSGYDTFKQEPTLYEPAGSFPVYFIPETGEACSEESVGCDEFTNLTNEAKEYYTYLRACLTPAEAAANTNGDNSATFYTWEGSDLAGYQLKTWQLLESNLTQSTYQYVSGGIDESPELAPCSTWTSTADGIICSDALDTDGDGHKDWDIAACDDHDDIFLNPDCREFYDTNGGLHYRQWSKTVTVSDACTAYRKTELVGVDLAAQTANCTNSGGFFDAAIGICRYNGLTGESNTCAASANGCRSYTGGRSRNSRVVLEDSLELGNLNNWDTNSAANVTLSNESLATGGHSIAATARFATFLVDNGSACTDPAGCPGTARSLGGSCVVSDGEQYCGTLVDDLFSSKTYTLSFWAKGSGTLAAGFDLEGGSGIDAAFGTVNLSSGWQLFTLGPLDMSAAAYSSFGDGTTLTFDPEVLAYIDNITLREGEDNITVIKDSWVTPSVCDQSPTGAASPQYYLGCQEYRTQNNETAYLKSFSKLCSQDKVGCEDFFQTHESNSPYAQVFQATCSNPSGAPVTSATSCYYENNGAGAFDTTSQYLCTIGIGLISCDFDLDWYESPINLPSHITYGPSTVVVPADSDVFVVVNDDVTCSPSAAGCTEVGKVKWNQDRNSTAGADSVFLKNDPDEYADTLCNDGELFCAAWDTDTDGQFYFKDPGDQSCQYRTGVQINGTDYDGWFRAGTDAFCYGTCSTNGNAACSSDADCAGANNFCDTSVPSYIVNGTLSGIWNNGDTTYGGWVGQCDAQNSACSEFQDPLDLETDERYQKDTGKKYYYLNNQNLDENVLPSSQRCNGQVSLKQGCALFNDTSEPSQGFNDSATEVSSRHADLFFGRAPYALVDPIDCEVGDASLTLADGTSVDLCAQRCVYDKGLVNDITDGKSRNTKLSEEVPNNPDRYGLNDLYITGTSCYEVADCGTMRADSGKEIEAIGCLKKPVVTRAGANNGTEVRESVKRLENDTNTILKVNRDRQCSEWLTCSEDQATWDARTSSFKTVCSDLELCTEYSSVIGGTSFCSKYKDDEAEVVLDREVYSARDTSWYGQEYSGYAIPDLFPVQTLTQANVAPPPNHCDLTDALKAGDVNQSQYDSKHGANCTEANQATTCGGNYCVIDDHQDFRLALVAGTCSSTAPFADECTVGFCKNTGAACSATSDCGSDGGTCLVGFCQTPQVNAQGGAHCTSDDNCSAGDICSGGTCVTPGANVSVETYNNAADPADICGNGQEFADDIDLKIGSCIRGQCILTPNGKTFKVAKSEGQICRAQPEPNSPFSNELVDQWLNPADNSPLGQGVEPSGIDKKPYQVRAGFENVNLCASGEDCSCNYRKLTFGTGGEVRYWDDETIIDEVAKPGLCSVGKVGVSCADDADCNVVDGSGHIEINGECDQITHDDVLLGLQGYCLEKDSGININGDRDKKACLTWLPVDQLAGSTDIYAKATQAGYFDDVFACSYVSPFVNLNMSIHPELGDSGSPGTIACADFEEASGQNDVNDQAKLDVCADNVRCPVGYWALMSMPHFKDGGMGTMNDACAINNGQNDCAYVCIPKGATTIDSATQDVKSCDYDGDDNFVVDLKNSFDVGDWDRGNGGNQDVKVVQANVDGRNSAEQADKELYLRFDNMVDALKDCSLKGVRMTDDVVNDVLNQPFIKAEYYAACEEVVQLADASKHNGYAWTDRLLSPSQNPAFTAIVSSTPSLQFGKDANKIFGFSGTNPKASVDDGYWPLVVATCQYKTTTEGVYNDLTQPLSESPDFEMCDISVGLGPYDDGETVQNLTIANPSDELKSRTSPASAAARSFVGFHFDHTHDSWETPDSFEVDNPSTANDDIFAIINQLFAGVRNLGNNRFIWNKNGGGAQDEMDETSRQYTAGEIDDTAGHTDVLSVQDVRAESGKPPKVWSLKAGTCQGTECEEGSLNSLTVNDTDSGNHEGVEFLKAYLKFYAAADKNQLPIRRVIIDWGDEIDSSGHPTGFQGSAEDNNFYENHRGLDRNTDTSICDLGNEWGQTPESCDPNYFSYSHVYTCRAEILSDNSRECDYDGATGVLLNSPCWQTQGQGSGANQVCVFQPRVHIRDNWGWCTGTCLAGADDGTEGCYEGDDYDSLSDITAARSECGYAASTNTVGGPVDPWVYYNGNIIVDPQE